MIRTAYIQILCELENISYRNRSEQLRGRSLATVDVAEVKIGASGIRANAMLRTCVVTKER